MNLSTDVLLRIFTYHQVPPCYLNFVTCSGSQTGASDVGFGGFRAHSLLKEPNISPKVLDLGRSGVYYRMSIKLQSNRRDTSIGAITEDSRQGAFAYRRLTAAIYHQFDVDKGTALWIITNPLDRSSENPLWNDLESVVRIADPKNEDHYAVASERPGVRFEAPLDVLISLAEWSIGDTAFYLHHLDEKLSDVVSCPRPESMKAP